MKIWQYNTMPIDDASPDAAKMPYAPSPTNTNGNINFVPLVIHASVIKQYCAARYATKMLSVRRLIDAKPTMTTKAPAYQKFLSIMPSFGAMAGTIAM